MTCLGGARVQVCLTFPFFIKCNTPGRRMSGGTAGGGEVQVCAVHAPASDLCGLRAIVSAEVPHFHT